MGVIVIPKISVKLPIYHGTGEDVLAVGQVIWKVVHFRLEERIQDV